jgi:hypothetical protein
LDKKSRRRFHLSSIFFHSVVYRTRHWISNSTSKFRIRHRTFDINIEISKHLNYAKVPLVRTGINLNWLCNSFHDWLFDKEFNLSIAELNLFGRIRIRGKHMDKLFCWAQLNSEYKNWIFMFVSF